MTRPGNGRALGFVVGFDEEDSMYLSYVTHLA